MDDLISRQAVLNATSTTLKITGKENAETVYEYIKKLCDDIKALPSAQQWIPCLERLPEKHKTVLITHRGGVSFGWHNGKHWERGASQNHRPLQTVAAWMPLPEPYKGDK